MEDKKTNEELLKEVKELKETVKKDSDDKKKNSGYNTMIVVGIILVAVAFYLWRCSGIF